MGSVYICPFYSASFEIIEVKVRNRQTPYALVWGVVIINFKTNLLKNFGIFSN